MDRVDPNEIFRFEFSADGRPESVTVGRSWHRQIGPDEFGAAAAQAFMEQRTAASAVVPRVDQSSEGTTRYPQEFKDQVHDFSQQVSELLGQFRQWQPKPSPEPVEVGDRYRNVIVQAVGGLPAVVEVDQSWVRSADLAEVEGALIEAFTAALDTHEEDPLEDKLGQLRARYASLVQHRNELNER